MFCDTSVVVMSTVSLHAGSALIVCVLKISVLNVD